MFDLPIQTHTWYIEPISERSHVTGSNLRQILLLVNKSDVDDLVPEDSSKIQYRPEDEENTWKIRMVKELIEVRNGTLQVDNFNEDEIKEVLDSLCVD